MAYDVSGLPTEFMNPGELEVFLGLIGLRRSAVVVEFGVNRGRNAAAALRNFPFIRRYVGIDVLPGYVPAMRCQRNEVPSQAGDLVDDPRFELILRERGSYDLLPEDLPAAAFYFIDGDHSRAGVLNDRALALASAVSGGIILYHDDNGRPEVEVSQTLNELRDNGAAIYHIEDTWFAWEAV